ncbi:MAG: hypothetical protein KatS3mg016_0488 [Fimbriimonadales bacterium]|nr:MAG: hypothetical protein KatS3mg016_0488 [Fimbriimonadales bacterium]
MRLIVVVGCALWLLACVCAQPADALQIRALNYRLQRTPEGEWLLELVGKVSIEYQGRRLVGERFLLDTENAQVRSDAPFSLIADEGALNGQRMEYFYEQGRGRFEEVQANLLGVYLDAASLEGDLNNFTAQSVTVSTCDPLRPPIRIRASSVRLHQGARLTLRNAQLFLYGRPFLALPYLTVRVRETAEVVSLPSPVYSAETGWGARIRLELPVGDQAVVQASAISYLRAIPETRVAAGVALTEGDPILGEPELRLRFEQSALYNLRVSPERTSPPRGLTLRGEYATNIRPLFAPRERLRLSRRELGLIAPIAYCGGFGEISLRYGTVSERIGNLRTPTRTRFTLEGDWMQPLWRDGDLSLHTHLWASYTHYVDIGDYQWIRPQIEVLWQPRETLLVMAGYARASTRGASPFLTEQLRARREVSLRTEYRQGNLRLGALLKYDVENRDLYDVQLLVGWRDRCLEPYLFWRRTPSAVLIGVNLTTLNF